MSAPASRSATGRWRVASLPVVDVGCFNHPGHQGTPQDSIAYLIRRFKPPTVYGFDPWPDMAEGRFLLHGVVVHLTRSAAWTRDGTISYEPRSDRPLSSAIGGGGIAVPCFDLARWLAGRRVILKLDVQGAEYPILEHLHAQGRDQNVDRLLVEWHPLDGWEERRDALLGTLVCPVEEWGL